MTRFTTALLAVPGCVVRARSERLPPIVSRISVFLTMRNAEVQETPVVRYALRRVADLLPASWALYVRPPEVQTESPPLDAVVDIVGPNREQVSFAVEAKRSGSVPTKTLIDLLLAMERQAGLPILFVSDYIGPALRSASADNGISFADATGWVRIANDSPLILLTGQGADRSPRTRTSAVSRLNGRATGRTIRALVAAELPVGVRDLAALAKVAPSSVSKLLVTLASEGIVDRDSNGNVLAVRRRSLIRRWVRDYDYAKTNTSIGYYIAPRGLERTLTRLGGRIDVTLTGSAAARRSLPPTSTPVVPLRLLALYAADPPGLAQDLGLVAADRATANVVIAVPQDTTVLPGAHGKGPAIAPAALVLADLLTLPGRSDAEANQLMDALAAVDPAWEE